MSPSDTPAPSGGSEVPGVPARGERGPLVFHGKARRRKRRIIGVIAAALAVVVFAAAVFAGVSYTVVFRQVGIGPIKLLPVGAVAHAEYFTDYSRGLIERLTPSGSLTIFALPSGAHPGAIVVGPDHALWWLDVGQNEIGRMTTSGAVREFSIPTGRSGLTGLCVGPEGNIWFTEPGSNQIGEPIRQPHPY